MIFLVFAFKVMFFIRLGQLLRLLSQSSEVEPNPKTNILFFDDLGGLFRFFAFWSMFIAQIARLINRS